MNDVEFVCDQCGSEWTRAIPGGQCLDCGNLLTDVSTGLKTTPEASDAASLAWDIDDEDDEDDDDELLTAFDTNNPYLQKLFSMKEYGQAPGMALSLLREVSPDPEEEFLTAIKCKHGALNRGYLMVTTDYIRWIQVFPRRQDDFWTYNDVLDVEHGVISTSDGNLFQTSRGRARKFAALYRVAQQAWLWEEGHTEAEVIVPGPLQSVALSADIADQLERIAQLLEKGLLTQEEFAQAKAKLLS